jgi:hypothetical protein
MKTRPGRYLLCQLPALLLLGLAAIPAQAQRPKAPQWAYAFDLSCRKFGEAEFTKDTKKFGVEVFRDTNTGLGVYLSQVGALGLANDFGAIKAPLKDSRAPDWIAGLDLKARKAGEQEFTQATKTHSMEVFRDGNSNNWIYITERGLLAVCPARTEAAGGTPKAPVWLHSMDLRVRKAGNKVWDKTTPAYGLEVYKDVNTGNLIYITETGAVATVSGVEAPSEAPKTAKGPQWLHGLDLQVRKVGEKNFTRGTRKIGVEIFRDANNDNVIVITEIGNIAVVPGKKGLKAPTPSPRDPRFLHGLDLSCRQAGEKDFTDKTKSYAIEVFREENLGLFIYICENGEVAAVAAKQ